jgi:hypothetical protein
MALQHLRSSTADKRPTPGAMSDGQLALNTNLASPGLFFKDSNGDSVKIGPVHVGTTAPNVTPGAGGQAGNSKGEAWLDTTAANPILKVFNGSAFVAVQPVGTGTVVSTTDTGTVTSTMILDGTILNADVNASAAIAGTKISPDFGSQTVTTTGVISSALGAAATPSITFTGDLNTGIYSPGADQVAVSTGGVERINIEADGDINIDGGGVYYDATNNRLAIGTTAPVEKLIVADSGSANVYIALQNSTTGTTSADGWYLGAAGTEFQIYGKENGPITFSLNSSEKARIDTSGSLLVGTSTVISNGYGGTSGLFQVAKNDFVPIGFFTYTSAGADGYCPYLELNRARGTQASPSAVLSGDELGEINFYGHDGSTFIRGASIRSYVDGTPGTNDMPGRLVFSTTADGAGSPTERMIINSSGTVLPATDNAYYLGVGSNRWIAVYAVNGTIQTSDKREKTEIQASALGIDFIKSLKPVSYKWNIGQNIVSKSDDGKTDVITPREGVRRHWGFIAQDVEESVNKAGVDFGGWLLEDKDDPDSRQALRYDQFIAPLTKALQEAIAKIETLEGMVAVNNITIDEQQHQLSTLAARLTALESA